MAVKCFFSGVESGQHWDQCVSVGVVNVLMSYWQFYQRMPRIVAERKKQNPKLRFLIDSGAHSFITDWTKFKTWTRADFDAYVEGYAKWLEANLDHIWAAVELDIDYTLNMVLGGSESSTIGTSIVESWQKKYFEPLEKKGLQIIYVWHTERRIEGWEDMCARFQYVGLPGEMSNQPDFNRFITIARRYCTKIHGFAATKQRDFRDVPWYSIDSITWKTGEIYGTLLNWDERAQKLEYIDDKTERPRLRSKLDANGFDADAVIQDTNYKEVTRFSLWSMRRMEGFYEEKYAERTYYYELRLPVPNIVAAFSERRTERWSDKMRFATLFKKHVNAPWKKRRQLLTALSSVQYADSSTLKSDPTLLELLKDYFPKLADPLVADLRVFQKELASYIAPPNPAALRRMDMELYEPQNNPPKERDPKWLDDISFDPDSVLCPDFVSTFVFEEERKALPRA